MPEALTLTIPVPPSLNNAYATFRGRRLLSREGKAFKEMVKTQTLLELRKRFTKGSGSWYLKGDRLSLTVALHFANNRRRDISNCTKLLEDALSEYLGFDDSAVDVLHVERKENDKANPRCEVRLEVL